VAREDDVCTVGVDAEPALPLPLGVLELISLPEEQVQIQRVLDANSSICWDRLLFCIKEATYKAWFPLTHRWLDFHDVLVEMHAGGAFRGTVSEPCPRLGSTFSGRWVAGNGILIAGIAGGVHCF
jgi:4'-phosphopantetheinyl transferase EntD